MPSIRITRHEAERGLLPPVCMITGEPTTATKRHTFRWTPPWVSILILAGLLPYVIVAMVTRKQMTFDVPVAAGRKWHWLWRQLFAIFGILGCIGLVFVGIALSNGTNNNRVNQGPDFGLITAAAAGIGLVVTLVIALILQYTSVRPSEITDREITLAGVHENFVVALEDDRDRDEEEAEERRAAKRAKSRDRDEDAPKKARRIRDDEDYE